MAPSGARPSTGPEKHSALRAGQRLDGAVASRGRPPARSLRGRDRRSEARVSLVFGGLGVMGGRRASHPLPMISTHPPLDSADSGATLSPATGPRWCQW
jgi:hypothetical protein